MIKWCNDQGGINGRQIVGDYYDAAITQVNTVMQQACKTDFMLVGEGWALDEAAERTRVGCNLAAVPGFAVGPDFANGRRSYQPVPNPDDYLPASIFYEMAKLFPQDRSRIRLPPHHPGLGHGVDHRQGPRRRSDDRRLHMLNCGVTLNYNGEPDYKPFAAEVPVVRRQDDLHQPGGRADPVRHDPGHERSSASNPIYMAEANEYSASRSSVEHPRPGQQHLHPGGLRAPRERRHRARRQAVHRTSVKAVGGKTDQLGEQAASAFLLWATAAKSCGSTLTRQCMVNYLSKVHSWTGGGLHAPTDPGGNKPSRLRAHHEADGHDVVAVLPKTTRGQYDCNPKYLFTITSADWGTTLGADRIATKFLGPNIIKPQS